jgi:hypothetical protein
MKIGGRFVSLIAARRELRRHHRVTTSKYAAQVVMSAWHAVRAFLRLESGYCDGLSLSEWRR